ncbi:MAG: leucine-rich repeat domain-containing protein [Bacteroidales bacterium]|nr:leucine-rich repeat domain-containing protein [Bacteroidales bacterium]
MNYVTEIGNNAFTCDSAITGTLTIPANITKIGNRAFSKLNGITEVVYNAITVSDASIGQFFEYSRRLQTLVIGQNVQYIPKQAFRYDTSLSQVVYMATNATTGTGIFLDCAKIGIVTITANVTSIPDNLFNYRPIDSLSIRPTTPPAVGANSFTIGNNNAMAANSTAMTAYNDDPIWHTFFLSIEPGPATINYSVTVNSENITMGSATASATVAEGGTHSISATANSHYHFTQWADGNTDNPRTVTVYSDMTYTACFASDTMANIIDTACGTFTWHETIYIVSGTYYWSVAAQSYSGDSVQVLNLVVRDRAYDTIQEAFRTNPYSWRGQTATSLGYVLNDTVVGAGTGSICDSVYTLELVACDTAYGDTTHDAYRNSAYSWRGKTATGIGFVYDTVAVPSGLICDSIYALELVTCDTVYDTTEATIPSSGGSYDWFGHSYTVVGIYDTAVVVATGTICDSLFTLVLSEAPYHTIAAVSANPTMGNATVVGSTSVATGSTGTVQATPNEGYRFDRWSNGSTSNPLTITVTQDTTMTAYFVAGNVTLTVRNANVGRGIATGSGTYAYGSRRNIAAAPNGGYRFSHWNDGDTNAHRIITLRRDTTFTAYFDVAQYHVDVMTSNYAQGAVSGSGDYDYMSYATISATPRNGYEFQRWSDGNTSNPRQIQVTGNISLTAYFTMGAQRYHLTAVSADPTMGSVSGSGTYDANATVMFSATANEGYQFVSWNDGETVNPRSVTLTSDTTFTATFAAYDAPETYTVTVLSDNESMGRVSGSGEYHEGDTVMVYAYPAPHYHFVRWSNGQIYNPGMIIIGEPWGVTGDVTLTAYFAPDSATITVQANNDAMGTVSGGGKYAIGTQVTISATPKSGYRFSHWSIADGTNPYTFTATYDFTYTAIFERNTDGIDEAEAGTLRVWSEGMQIHVAGNNGETVRIYDVTGRTVAEGHGTNNVFIMGHPGLYMVQTSGTTRKVLVK